GSLETTAERGVGRPKRSTSMIFPGWPCAGRSLLESTTSRRIRGMSMSECRTTPQSSQFIRSRDGGKTKGAACIQEQTRYSFWQTVEDLTVAGPKHGSLASRRNYAMSSD